MDAVQCRSRRFHGPPPEPTFNAGGDNTLFAAPWRGLQENIAESLRRACVIVPSLSPSARTARRVNVAPVVEGYQSWSAAPPAPRSYHPLGGGLIRGQQAATSRQPPGRRLRRPEARAAPTTRWRYRAPAAPRTRAPSGGSSLHDEPPGAKVARPRPHCRIARRVDEAAHEKQGKLAVVH